MVAETIFDWYCIFLNSSDRGRRTCFVSRLMRMTHDTRWVHGITPQSASRPVLSMDTVFAAIGHFFARVVSSLGRRLWSSIFLVVTSEKAVGDFGKSCSCWGLELIWFSVTLAMFAWLPGLRAISGTFCSSWSIFTSYSPNSGSTGGFLRPTR